MMLQILGDLSPEEQAALVGLLVAVLVYVVRHMKPGWFVGASEVAKFQRTASVLLLSGLGVLVRTVSTGSWGGTEAFLLSWALAYASAEGAHTVVSRVSALGEIASPTATFRGRAGGSDLPPNPLPKGRESGRGDS